MMVETGSLDFNSTANWIIAPHISASKNAICQSFSSLAVVIVKQASRMVSFGAAIKTTNEMPIKLPINIQNKSFQFFLFNPPIFPVNKCACNANTEIKPILKINAPSTLLVIDA